MMVKTGCTCAVLKLLPDIYKKKDLNVLLNKEREKKRTYGSTTTTT
jgi:hypothetical protein